MVMWMELDLLFHIHLRAMDGCGGGGEAPP